VRIHLQRRMGRSVPPISGHTPRPPLGGTGGSAPRSPYGAASGNSHRPYAKFRSEGRGALGTVPPLFGLGNGDTVPLTFQGTGEELAVSVIRSQNHKILLSLYNSKVNEHDRFQCTLYFQCYHLYIPGHFSWWMFHCTVLSALDVVIWVMVEKTYNRLPDRQG